MLTRVDNVDQPEQGDVSAESVTRRRIYNLVSTIGMTCRILKDDMPDLEEGPPLTPLVNIVTKVFTNWVFALEAFRNHLLMLYMICSHLRVLSSASTELLYMLLNQIYDNQGLVAHGSS
ncbi:hypothetical protein KC19_VG142600 [Ceratodon purpureus]|uniref:Uncharacterized protein n=1 Tax=Ceratodon purpureus TaxID=3225 RepID=A0A8T0HPZ3_CERPU|nr:hypothetical protein KC19_VG142600 [Ceratodon purpureus]